MRVIVRTQKDASLFVARVAAGVVLFPHGLQKVFAVWGGAGLKGTIDYFTNVLGQPQWIAICVIVAETLGALGLVVGFLGRVCALGGLLVMGGAVWMAHLENGFFMNWSGTQAGEGFEYHILMMALLLIVLVGGSGPASVDARLSAPKGN